MDKDTIVPTDQRLVADFCDSEFASRSRGFLIPYAAEVFFIARLSRSSRLTAAFLAKKFGRNVSRRPVEDILKKIKSKEIIVTQEQLVEVAKQHPAAQHYAELFPDILNPNAGIEIEDAPPAKKTAKNAAKKTPTKKPEDEKDAQPGDPPAGTAEAPELVPQGGTTGLTQIITDEKLAEQRAKLAEAKRKLREGT